LVFVAALQQNEREREVFVRYKQQRLRDMSTLDCPLVHC